MQEKTLMQKMLLMLSLLSFVCIDIQAGKDGKKSGSPRKIHGFKGLKVKNSSNIIKRRKQDNSSDNFTGFIKQKRYPKKKEKSELRTSHSSTDVRKRNGFDEKNRSQSIPDLIGSSKEVVVLNGKDHRESNLSISDPQKWIGDLLMRLDSDVYTPYSQSSELTTSRESDSSVKSYDEITILKACIKSLQQDNIILRRKTKKQSKDIDKQKKIIKNLKQENKKYKKLGLETAKLEMMGVVRSTGNSGS